MASTVPVEYRFGLKSLDETNSTLSLILPPGLAYLRGRGQQSLQPLSTKVIAFARVRSDVYLSWIPWAYNVVHAELYILRGSASRAVKDRNPCGSSRSRVVPRRFSRGLTNGPRQQKIYRSFRKSTRTIFRNPVRGDPPPRGYAFQSPLSHFGRRVTISPTRRALMTTKKEKS